MPVLDSDLDELDFKIMDILAKRKYLTAEEIYEQISGFGRGRFGRTLVYVRLFRLSEKKHIEIKMSPNTEEDIVYSINK